MFYVYHLFVEVLLKILFSQDFKVIIETSLCSITNSTVNVQLKRFNLDGHTKGFHPQSQNLEQLYTGQQRIP